MSSMIMKPYFPNEHMYIIVPSLSWSSSRSVGKMIGFWVVWWIVIIFAHDTRPHQWISVNDMQDVSPLTSCKYHGPKFAIKKNLSMCQTKIHSLHGLVPRLVVDPTSSNYTSYHLPLDPVNFLKLDFRHLHNRSSK